MAIPAMGSSVVIPAMADISDETSWALVGGGETGTVDETKTRRDSTQRRIQPILRKIEAGTGARVREGGRPGRDQMRRTTAAETRRRRRRMQARTRAGRSTGAATTEGRAAGRGGRRPARPGRGRGRQHERTAADKPVLSSQHAWAEAEGDGQRQSAAEGASHAAVNARAAKSRAPRRVIVMVSMGARPGGRINRASRGAERALGRLPHLAQRLGEGDAEALHPARPLELDPHA